jgi:hypothetical protein
MWRGSSETAAVGAAGFVNFCLNPLRCPRFSLPKLKGCPNEEAIQQGQDQDEDDVSVFARWTHSGPPLKKAIRKMTTVRNRRTSEVKLRRPFKACLTKSFG